MVFDQRAEVDRGQAALSHHHPAIDDGILGGKAGQTTGALGALSSGFELVGMQKYADGLVAASMATDFFSGVGDLATLALKSTTIATVKSTIATKASTIAQRALNIVMRANPIGLVVTALVLLGTALVVAYKKSETFRRIVNGAFGLVKTAAGEVVGFVRDKFGGLVDFFDGLPGKITRGARGMWDGISNAFRAMMNVLVDLWNRLDFSIPKVSIPGLGSFGGGGDLIPDIPRLALGGIVRARPGGTVVRVAEAGRDEAVIPLGRGGGGIGGDTYQITVNGALDPAAVARQVQQMLLSLKRTNGGRTLGIA